jgi:hypothetical protein
MPDLSGLLFAFLFVGIKQDRRYYAGDPATAGQYEYQQDGPTSAVDYSQRRKKNAYQCPQNSHSPKIIIF